MNQCPAKNYFELWFNGTHEGNFILKHDVMCRVEKLKKRYPTNWIVVYPVKNRQRGPAMFDSLVNQSIYEEHETHPDLRNWDI